MIFLGIAEFVCLIGIPVALIGFLVQLVRKKPNKKTWGITLICFLAVFVVCIAITPTPETTEENNEVMDTASERKEEPDEDVAVTPEPEPTEESQLKTEKTEAEKFAENNGISVSLAESLESVLVGMELTDKSRVGIFHYDLSNVYEWKQIEDWANGQRYSAYMDLEHVWYIYVKDDVVVGVRDGNGNIFYSEE